MPSQRHRNLRLVYSQRGLIVKRLLALLIVALIPALAQAQLIAVQNEAGATKAPDAGDTNNNVAVDRALRLLVSVSSGGGGNLPLAIIPVSNSTGLNGPLSSINGYFNVGTDTIEAASTTTVLNLTAHVARVGDIIVPTGGTAGNIGVEIPVCAVATNSVTLCYPLPATPSTDAITIRRPKPLFTPLEDSAHVSGDTGIIPLGVVQTLGSGTQVILSSTSLDYVPPANNLYGASLIDWQYHLKGNGSTSPLQLEDIAFPADGAVVMSGAQAVSAIAQTVGTTGDAAPPSMDLGNRLVTTAAPTGSLYRGCNTAVTTATTGTILAAVASNFTYLTAVSCTNSGAAASFITIEDGDGSDIAVGYLAATMGTEKFTFPIVPARTGAVNKAIQVNVATTNTSTVCCAIGYTGVI
jgi:hypothetical protein